jgi:hypothetical protein
MFYSALKSSNACAKPGAFENYLNLAFWVNLNRCYLFEFTQIMRCKEACINEHSTFLRYDTCGKIARKLYENRARKKRFFDINMILTGCSCTEFGHQLLGKTHLWDCAFERGANEWSGLISDIF